MKITEIKKIKTHTWLPRRQGGAAMLIAVVFFLFITLAVISGLVPSTIREFRNASVDLNSKQSYFLTESGIEDAIYRISNNLTISDTEVITLNSNSVTTTISDVSDKKDLSAIGDVLNYQRKANVVLSVGEGATFNYGVQIGDGGLHMKNTSSISGNVFTTGPIIADNTPSISGDAISAGPTGLIDDISIFGDAYANNITSSLVSGDAYYQSISFTTVLGTKYPDSPDQSPVELPISDETIEDWKALALAGGTSTNCDITESTTIGPIKLNCDKLNISGSTVITLAGHVWVAGDIEFQHSAEITIAGSLGGNSVAMIAHDEADEDSSGTITLKNSVEFTGPNDNYILMVSMNNDAEANGGNVEAIEVQNSVDGDVLVYAPHGLVKLTNSVDLKEVTAYQLELQNSAEVIYDTGLVNLLFSSGPSGGYTIDSWQETE